jgi:hypothetical protein
MLDIFHYHYIVEGVDNMKSEDHRHQPLKLHSGYKGHRLGCGPEQSGLRDKTNSGHAKQPHGGNKGGSERYERGERQSGLRDRD